MERAIRLAWNYNQSCPWSVIEARRSRSAINYQLPVRRSRGEGGSPSSLLVEDLDLLIEHLAGAAIDRHVHPVTLFTSENEFPELRFPPARISRCGQSRRASDSTCAFGRLPRVHARSTHAALRSAPAIP